MSKWERFLNLETPPQSHSSKKNFVSMLYPSFLELGFLVASRVSGTVHLTPCYPGLGVGGVSQGPPGLQLPHS